MEGQGQAYRLVAQKKGYRTVTMEPDGGAVPMALSSQEDMILLEKGKKRGTVELQKKGYETSWITMSAGDGRSESAYCVPSQERQPVWSFVLTWDQIEGQLLDLDSCVFTPRQSLAGNMEYVSPINRDDGNGHQGYP